MGVQGNHPKPPAAPAAPSRDDSTRTFHPRDQDTRTIGPYRLLQLVGEGGMGEVYRAEQREPVRRRVAVKVIKPGMDSREVIARFESERQALAMMNHPNIARIYDAGTTDGGRPFFVMEFVDGVSITDYCDGKRLDTRDRLELFMKVCEGVNHAHQKGIIHRDIKPSNILVTIQDDRPVPKIIDFGVAKATHQRLSDKTLFTRMGIPIGTPRYMSPEQVGATGVDIDTRSDVYSLGVVLYQLLVGRSPFDPGKFRGASLDEIRRSIREEEPSRPSRKLNTLGQAIDGLAKRRMTDPSGLRRQLLGDLDWITMKALEKDRARRYQSALEFRDDIGRHLRHEPVIARPPSVGYRMEKFFRRHTALIAAAGAVVLALSAGIIATSWQAVRATRAEREARQEAGTALEVSDFLVGLFEVSDPSQSLGETITARELLDRGKAKISELADRPQVQARLMGAIGRVYLGLGLFDEARPLIEESLQILRAHATEDPLDLARGLNNSARYFWEINEFRLALPLLEEELKIQEAHGGRDGLGVANTLMDLALVYEGIGEYHLAKQVQERSLSIKQKILGEDDVEVARSLNNFGSLLSEMKEFGGAQSALERAYRIYRQHLEPNSPEITRVLANLGLVYLDMGDHERARRTLEEARNIEEKVLGPNHPEFGLTLNYLGEVEIAAGRYEKARDYFQKSLDIMESAYGPDNASIAVGLYNLACVYSLQRDREQALDLIRRAVGSGFSDPVIFEDTTLDYLRGDPDFEKQVAIVKNRIRNPDPARQSDQLESLPAGNRPEKTPESGITRD